MLVGLADACHEQSTAGHDPVTALEATVERHHQLGVVCSAQQLEMRRLGGVVIATRDDGGALFDLYIARHRQVDACGRRRR